MMIMMMATLLLLQYADVILIRIDVAASGHVGISTDAGRLFEVSVAMVCQRVGVGMT